jgi:hypothetical protein
VWGRRVAGCRREGCICMGSTPPFVLRNLVEAIAVDPGIENSDNVPKGFYGGGESGQGGRRWRRGVPPIIAMYQ